MDSARLRKAFKYPSDEDADQDHEEMDEEGKTSYFFVLSQLYVILYTPTLILTSLNRTRTTRIKPPNLRSHQQQNLYIHPQYPTTDRNPAVSLVLAAIDHPVDGVTLSFEHHFPGILRVRYVLHPR
jgi:hypothetical protein